MKKTISIVLILALGLATEVVNAATNNQAPIADAGLCRYAAKDPVHLDGTGSYDPDSSGSLSYEWRQIAGPSVVITNANTATPTVSGFGQTDEIQECEFELVVSDGELASLPDTVKIVIVPDFGPNSFLQENPPFDANKPTIIYFGGGDCTNGLAVDGWSPFTPAWLSRANIIYFPNGYTPDSGGNARTYYKYGDMIIVYLSSVAPDYKQPIQTIGWSTGGQPAVDVGIRLNLSYADARYAINRVTFFDAIRYCRDNYSESISTLLGSSVDGEQCWADAYVGTTSGQEGYVAGPPFQENVLNVWFPNATGTWYQRHIVPSGWYPNSLTLAEMNNFNHGVVAGAYWSVIGPGKNLQLASTPDEQTYKFQWYGDASSGYMDFYNEAQYPGRLPEPVTLLALRCPWLPDDYPNGILLTCQESENAVGYELLSGSDPYNVAEYNIMADSNRPPVVTAAMLPSSDTWWTIRARDAYGSTIHADPMRVDSPAGPDTALITLVDFNRDWKVDFKDFSMLAQHWHRHEPSVDIVPAVNCESIVDVKDLTILAERWLKKLGEPALISRWKLDETEGIIAHDSIGDKDGTVYGQPLWQPAVGKIDGALQLDGIDDYISTELPLDSSVLSFSVFAWVKGGEPGQVIISQMNYIVGRTAQVGSTWLGTDSSDGRLITKFLDPLFPPLESNSVITDGQWHKVGVVYDFDGFSRRLYVDGAEVARDETVVAGLLSAGSLRFGADKDLSAGSFFSGLIDDIQIYNVALSAKEIEELAR